MTRTSVYNRDYLHEREIIKAKLPLIQLGAGMRFVDAHIHLSDEEYLECTEETVVAAKNAEVVGMVTNSMNLKTSKRSLMLAKQYPRFVYAALGIHPWVVQDLTEIELQQTLSLISEQKQNKAVVAIGEIGLDSKYLKIWDRQMMIFSEMLHLAEKLNLPVIVHSRGTTSRIIEMLPSYRLNKVLLHWFSNPLDALPKAVNNGYYISDGPPIIYSKGIRDVVRKVPLTSFLTETDGPVRYFRPPFEGNRTTPAFIPTIVRAVAEIKGLQLEDVANQISRNFEDFFETQLS